MKIDRNSKRKDLLSLDGRETGSVIPLGDADLSHDLLRRRHLRYMQLGEKHRNRQKYEQAQRCIGKAIYLAVELDGPDHIQVAADLEALALVFFESGKHDLSASLMACACRIKRLFEN